MASSSLAGSRSGLRAKCFLTRRLKLGFPGDACFAETYLIINFQGHVIIMSKFLNILIGLILAGIIVYALLNMRLSKTNNALETNQAQSAASQSATTTVPEQRQLPAKKIGFKKARAVGTSGKSRKGAHRGMDGNLIQ